MQLYFVLHFLSLSVSVWVHLPLLQQRRLQSSSQLGTQRGVFGVERKIKGDFHNRFLTTTRKKKRISSSCSVRTWCLFHDYSVTIPVLQCPGHLPRRSWCASSMAFRLIITVWCWTRWLPVFNCSETVNWWQLFQFPPRSPSWSVVNKVVILLQYNPNSPPVASRINEFSFPQGVRCVWEVLFFATEYDWKGVDGCN